MGALQPTNVRTFHFGGTAASGVTHYVGAANSPFFPSPATGDEYSVPDMPEQGVVLRWAIRNNDASNNLLLRLGPATESFVAASGSVLSNFATLKPGVEWHTGPFNADQQVNDNVGGVDYSVLMIQGSGGTCTYTGEVYVWDPADG